MSVVTKLPTGPDTVVGNAGSTAVIRYSITESDVVAIESRRGLVVTDIHDKKQVEAVLQLHKDAKKGRTTVERERTEANAKLRKVVEDDIAWNNNAALALQSRLNPIEKETGDEISRVEAALEAERVEAANKVYRERCKQLADIGADPMPEQLIRAVSDVSFEQLLVTAKVQVEQKKIIAEQQRVAAEEAKRAEIERMRLQAEADERRAAEQAKLDAERAAFEKRQAEAAELQRKADEERAARIAQDELDRQHREAVRLAELNAKIAAERAELESQRMAIEDERKRQEIAEQQRQLELQRIADEQAEEQQRIEAVAKAAEEKARLEAMRPDIEKLAAWVASVEMCGTSQRPQVGKAATVISSAMWDILRTAINEMRGML